MVWSPLEEVREVLRDCWDSSASNCRSPSSSEIIWNRRAENIGIHNGTCIVVSSYSSNLTRDLDLKRSSLADIACSCNYTNTHVYHLVSHQCMSCAHAHNYTKQTEDNFIPCMPRHSLHSLKVWFGGWLSDCIVNTPHNRKILTQYSQTARWFQGVPVN